MAGPTPPTTNPPPVPSGGGLITYSDADCTVYEQTFEIGTRVYFDGQITSELARTATILARVYNSAGTLIATIINATANLLANTVYDLKEDLGEGTAYNIDTTGYAEGIYFLDVQVSGTGLPTIADLETFKIVSPASSKNFRLDGGTW